MTIEDEQTFPTMHRYKIVEYFYGFLVVYILRLHIYWRFSQIYSHFGHENKRGPFLSLVK